MHTKKFRLVAFVMPTVFISMLGCAPDSQSTATDDIAAALLSTGLTCDMQHELLALEPEDLVAVASIVRDQLSPVDLEALLATEESCTPTAVAGITASEAALGTGTPAGESIERTYSSGGVTGSVGRDGSSLGWMCGGGSPESPADYVLSVSYLPNAYANRSRLRVRANTIWSSAALGSFGNALSARVYSDNSARVCVGYWRMTLYGAGYLFPSDFSFLLDSSSW
jgi:hypothetical protein